MSATTSSDSDPGDPTQSETWSLVRITGAAPQHGLNSTLAEIRLLDSNERQRILDAEVILNRFGPAWAHTMAVHRATDFAEAVNRMVTGRTPAGGQINQSDLDRVSAAIRAFSKHLAQWASEAASTPGAVADAAETAVGLPVLVICQRIAVDEPFTLLPGNDQAISVTFADGSQVEANSFVAASLGASRLIADAELAEAEDSLMAAGQLVMSLRAEVVWGDPALVRTSDFQQGPMTLSPQAIEWRKVEAILTACAIARTAIAQRASVVATGATGVGGAPARTPGIPDTSVTGDGDPIPTTPQNGSPIEPAAAVPHADPADMGLLLREATALAQSSEQRWSQALGSAVTEDINGLLSRARSLLAVLSRRAINQDADDVTLPAIPLTPDTANDLTLTPDIAQEQVQRGLARVYAIMELAQAIQALNQPTGLRIDLVQGSTISWWTQHGFNHLQYKEELATRILIDSPTDAIIHRPRDVPFGNGVMDRRAARGCRRLPGRSTGSS